MTYPLPLFNKRYRSNISMKKIYILLVTFIISLSPLTYTQAQLNPLSKTEAPAEKSEKIAEDPYGRHTPRGTVQGYLAAMAKEDYDRAALYLDFKTKTNGNKNLELTQKLKFYLDKSGKMEPQALISDEPSGKLNDELEINFDNVGLITYQDKNINVTLEKVSPSAGENIWLFSKTTLNMIDALPAMTSDYNISIIDRFLPNSLIKNKIKGVPTGHIIAILLILTAAIFISMLMTKGLKLLVRHCFKGYEEKKIKILSACLVPITIAFGITIFVLGTEKVGISIIARQMMSSFEIIGYWIALLILIWELIGIFTWITEQNMLQRKNYGSISAIFFFKRSMKFALVFIGFILCLNTLGFDVTTGIAALGIGGIAVALGAQKTIENIVGSLTLIIDQPVRVGDFCKVGDIKGTIEQIGIRSSRIRTADRTIIVIPNGYFASLAIENYTHRDSFWLNLRLGFRFETTPDQIRFLLVEIRSILYAHPKISDEPARVRFLGFGADALTIEVYGYVLAKNYTEFLEIQEDVNLRIADIVKASGTDFAFPSQTIYFARDSGISKEKIKEIEEIVADWKAKGELQIPNFKADKIKSLQGTIEYPPKDPSTK